MGREMIWPVVGQHYLESFQRARLERQGRAPLGLRAVDPGQPALRSARRCGSTTSYA